MRKAVVIRTVGDEELAGAIVDGMVQPLHSEELEAVKAEMAAIKMREASLAVRTVRDAAYYERKIRRLNKKYPPERELNKVAAGMLIAWAVTSCAVVEWFKMLLGAMRGE